MNPAPKERMIPLNLKPKLRLKSEHAEFETVLYEGHKHHSNDIGAVFTETFIPITTLMQSQVNKRIKHKHTLIITRTHTTPVITHCCTSSTPAVRHPSQVPYSITGSKRFVITDSSTAVDEGKFFLTVE